MAQMTQTLPLLPLTSGVILPGMVFTMALETEEARVAVEAAGSAGGRLVLVPHIDGRYAVVGVVAEIVERGEIPGGPPAMIVRGLERAAIGTGVPGTGQALWVQVEPISEGPATDNVTELAREYRAVLENILLSRGARQLAERLRDVTEPSQVADLAGYSPDLSLAQKVQVLETINVEERLRLVLGWPGTPWPTSLCASRSRAASRRGWRRPSGSSCCAGSSRPSARNWASSKARQMTGPPSTTVR